MVELIAQTTMPATQGYSVVYWWTALCITVTSTGAATATLWKAYKFLIAQYADNKDTVQTFTKRLMGVAAECGRACAILFLGEEVHYHFIFGVSLACWIGLWLSAMLFILTDWTEWNTAKEQLYNDTKEVSSRLDGNAKKMWLEIMARPNATESNSRSKWNDAIEELTRLGHNDAAMIIEHVKTFYWKTTIRFARKLFLTLVCFLVAMYIAIF